MYTFSVIIVSWNALEHLKTFLPSVAETDYPHFEILLADNASTDGSPDWVQEHYPEIRVVSLDRNYGYCGGNNRAAPEAEGDILVFLNNDVKVEPDWLFHLNRCFESDREIAAAQPKMLSYKNPSHFEYAGAAGGFIDRYGYPFCRGRIFDTIEEDRGQYDRPGEIFWASGAAFAVRKHIFKKNGGFDEDFEFHMEEIDLSWRIQNRGNRIYYCPESVVYHLGGGSLPMGSPRKVYYNYRNNLLMLWKNYNLRSLLFRFPIRILLDVVSAVRLLLIGDFPDVWAIVRAHAAFLKKLPGIHKKRIKLNRGRSGNREPKNMVNKSIVWQYFIKGRNTFTDIESLQ